jgi:hypothetical protein
MKEKKSGGTNSLSEKSAGETSTRSLKGSLASKKGKTMSFSEIREAATKAVQGREQPVNRDKQK